MAGLGINSWKALISGGFFSLTNETSWLCRTRDRQLCLAGMHIWGHFLIRVKEILISKSYLHFETHLIRPAAACKHERWYADVQPAQELVLRMVFGKLEGIKRLVISYGMPWWRQIKSLKEPPRSLGKCPYTELVKHTGWFSRITPSKMLQFISPVILFKKKKKGTIGNIRFCWASLIVKKSSS